MWARLWHQFGKLAIVNPIRSINNLSIVSLPGMSVPPYFYCDTQRSQHLCYSLPKTETASNRRQLYGLVRTLLVTK
jgi:hypothetical protein